MQLVGCSLLGVGIWAKVDERSFAALIGNDGIMHTISIAAYAIIVLGTIVTFLGFLGCCGAIRENQCMLATVSGLGHVIDQDTIIRAPCFHSPHLLF